MGYVRGVECRDQVVDGGERSIWILFGHEESLPGSYHAEVSSQPVEVLPAATVILVTDQPKGLQVLMVHRQPRGFFGGLTVFPGGGVEDYDASAAATNVADGSFDDESHRIAALRELAEETGVLLVAGRETKAPDVKGSGLFLELADQGLAFDLSRLVLVSRWVTPEGAPKRFDAWFYLSEVESALPVTVDGSELTGHDWTSPDEALRRHEEGEWKMFLPTIAHLRWLAKRESVAEALAAARGSDGRTLIEPRRMEDGSLVPLHLPAEPS